MADEKKATDPASDGSYQVGYRKPPKRTRFQPGQSGNPRGRPKGTKNLKTDLMEELQESILVREGIQRIKLSKQRALIKGLTARALKGDARATNTLVNLCSAWSSKRIRRTLNSP